MARRRAARVRSKKPAGKPARRRRRRRAPPVRVSEASLAAYAHDIRTALTGILALGELLASSNLGERERRWASSIKGSAEHLAALTSLMIDGARADAGALRLQDEVFRPRRLIEVLGDSLAARAEAKGLGAEVTVADDVPELLVGDAVRLRAALENLIDNAVKFTERGGVRLDVRAGRATRGRVRLVFTVTDSGIGLKPAEIKRLFRPFAQANAEIARRYGGTGLGLAVVKHLAKLMGGDLTVTSRYGRGSRFRLSAVLAIGCGGSKRAAATAGGAAPAHRPVRGGQPLRPGHPQHHPRRARSPRRLRRLRRGSGRRGRARLRRRAGGRDAARHRRPRNRAPHPCACRNRGVDADHRHYRPQRGRRREQPRAVPA